MSANRKTLPPSGIDSIKAALPAMAGDAPLQVVQERAAPLTTAITPAEGLSASLQASAAALFEPEAGAARTVAIQIRTTRAVKELVDRVVTQTPNMTTTLLMLMGLRSLGVNIPTAELEAAARQARIKARAR